MKKILLLLGLITLATSCEKWDDEFCGCNIEGEYYTSDGTQYRINNRYEGRMCDQARSDTRYQVQLLRNGCYTCGTGINVTLQDAINNGSVRLTDHCY